MRKIWVWVILIMFVMSGCESIEDCEECPALLNVDGKTYVSTGVKMDGKYSPDELIGKVKKKVARHEDVGWSWESNFLDVGTEVYATREDKTVLLARVNHEEYEVFILQ